MGVTVSSAFSDGKRAICQYGCCTCDQGGGYSSATNDPDSVHETLPHKSSSHCRRLVLRQFDDDYTDRSSPLRA
jgi:hypothetical protein